MYSKNSLLYISFKYLNLVNDYEIQSWLELFDNILNTHGYIDKIPISTFLKHIGIKYTRIFQKYFRIYSITYSNFLKFRW